MEETSVVIVGAGPAGLSLALSLAKHEIYSIILEKEQGISEDPRGVYLAGDAVRILYQLGIGDQMRVIGHSLVSVNFHKSTFKTPPFFILDRTYDWFEQAVSNGIVQIQPRLEDALRCKIKQSKYCQLRCSCRVTGRQETEDGIVVEYEDENAKLNYVKCSYLIGADGKTGIVRKQFLEMTAGIRQETGLFSYSGTWVAANLKITLPTPESHPGLSLWEMGLTPEDVYDLFWPTDWHFCSPPGKATACGRFGPVEDRLWRHEFAEPHWVETKDTIELLWEHLVPMITRNADALERPFPSGNITFPRDCIEIRRCRPFTFCQKVVNKWFHERTILIGDAAHVFPPFGGQGIACGIQDADSLAWRLAILLRLDLKSSLIEETLLAWSLERRQGVDKSTRLTMANGKLANEPETWGFSVMRNVAAALAYIPFFPSLSKVTAPSDKSGYRRTKGGFFLSEYNGGGKIAQIYVKRNGKFLLSDQLLKHGETIMTLLVLDVEEDDQDKVRAVVRSSNVPQSILSETAIVCVSTQLTTPDRKREIYTPCSQNEIEGILPGYDERSYLRRFPVGTKYAIIRPDCIIYAAAKTLTELTQCLEILMKGLT